MGRDDPNREPCPWRIVDDAGGAFCFGLAGGLIWHSIGGARNAPKGHMMAQALSRVKTRVPILGGSFAVWGTLFSCFDCTFTHLRKKEDPWNAILSGAATGGLLAARAGAKVAAKNAAVGGVILAAIEGLNVLVSRVLMPFIEKRSQEQSGAAAQVDRLEPPVDPLRRRTGRVQHVPIEFTPSFDSGTGSSGSLGFSLSDSSSSSSSRSSGSSSSGSSSSGSGGGGFDSSSISDFSQETWSAGGKGQGQGDGKGSGSGEGQSKKGWLW